MIHMHIYQPHKLFALGLNMNGIELSETIIAVRVMTDDNLLTIITCMKCKQFIFSMEKKLLLLKIPIIGFIFTLFFFIAGR